MKNPAATFIMHTLLKSAIYFEEQSRDFYNEAVERVATRNGREILRKLADSEAQHMKKLEKLSEDEHVDEVVLGEHILHLPPVTADEDSAPVISTSDSLHDILKTAHKREIASEAFYAELANKSSLETAKKVFEYLAEEEESHISYIEKLLQETDS